MESVERALLYLDLAAEAVDDQAAIDLASHLARRHGTRVTAVHVVPDAPWYANLLHPSGDQLQQALIERQQALLAERVGVTAEQGLALTPQVRTGRPSLEITREVLRSEQQLVIKGANDRPARGGLLPDATSRSLLRRCPCPVWLVRAACAARRPRRVLVAIKPEPFRPASLPFCRTLLTWADWAARTTQSELHVLDVVNVSRGLALYHPSGVSDFHRLLREALRDAERCFEEHVEPCVSPIPDDRLWFVDGDPATTIPEFVETHGIGLLVMGTARHASPGGLLMGDVAEHVIDRVGCSVLGLKPDAIQSPGQSPEEQEASPRNDGAEA